MRHRSMRQRAKELSVLVGLLVLAGGLVMASGIVPIRASSGHWPITRWLLTFASGRSISLHSRGIAPPTLESSAAIRLGAATYDSNCRWCHGRPGLPMPAVAAEMTPHPPYLPNVLAQWESRELFYIGKHGIKFAGMPAWPTRERDDGIWPVVAFLEQFPSLNEETYNELVRPKRPSGFGSISPSDLNDSERAVSALVEQACAACHGFWGRGRAGRRVPAIAGQNREYLAATLLAYRSGTRFSGVMQPIAARLQESEIAALSNYFAQQEPATISSTEVSNPNDGPDLLKDRDELIQLGERLAMEGIAQDKIPSCVDCHGPVPLADNERYPQLAGLSAWYIRKHLDLFATNSRGGTDRAHLMHPIADKLSAEQKSAVALYYAQASRDEADTN